MNKVRASLEPLQTTTREWPSSALPAATLSRTAAREGV